MDALWGDIYVQTGILPQQAVLTAFCGAVAALLDHVSKEIIDYT
jgi:hypothetical protein